MRPRKTLHLVGALLALSGAGCASTGGRTSTGGWGSSITSKPSQPQAVPAAKEAKTASGRPEVVVQGATKKHVMDALTNRLASSGWNVAQTNEYQATYETDAKGAAGFVSDVFYGHATQPVYRLTTQFLETQAGIRVIGNLELVTNPGTPRTTRTEMNSGKSRNQIQALLDAVRDETARVPLPAPAVGDSAAAK